MKSYNYENLPVTERDLLREAVDIFSNYGTIEIIQSRRIVKKVILSM